MQRCEKEMIALFRVWELVSRLQKRIERISARIAQGDYLGPWPRAGGFARNHGHGAPYWTREPFPRHAGWLVRRSPDFAQHGEALLRMLAEPEMLALLKAAPELKPGFRRLLRLLGATCPPAVARPAQPPIKAMPASPTDQAVPTFEDLVEISRGLLGLPETWAEEDCVNWTPLEWVQHDWRLPERFSKPRFGSG